MPSHLIDIPSHGSEVTFGEDAELSGKAHDISVRLL